MNKFEKLIFISILVLGAFFRFYNLNWDQNFHLHPDERAIVLYALPLSLPANIPQFFSPESSLNPHFFAYGSLPLYLLKILGAWFGFFDKAFQQYDGITIIGRFISAFADLGTMIVLYLLAKKIFSKSVGLIAMFLYAVSILPIQLSHFYAVDTLLTFFIISTLYILIKFYEKPTKKTAFLIGLFFGLSLATKVSALVLIIAIGVTLSVDFLLLFIKMPHKPHVWIPALKKFFRRLFPDLLIITSSTLVTFIIFEPYAIFSFPEFWQQTLQQSQMTHDAFTFPYTLQYVGKIPYLYEIKNVMLWGLGLPLGAAAIIGAFSYLISTLKMKNPKQIIILTFFVSYFLVVGSFAIGFMRYMLPLYPLFAIFTGFFLFVLTKKLSKRKRLLFPTSVVFFFLFLLWPLSFLAIYTRANTRAMATQWIYENIQPDKTLAVEHWDDKLPLEGSPYKTLTLALYDAETDSKWQIINQQLQNTDYIIIASNRLYTPLQKLTDCRKLYPHLCYTQSAKYYKELFSGQRGFRKVAQFSSFPTIPFTNLRINDQNADESFTVYDHPVVMIFKKLSK